MVSVSLKSFANSGITSISCLLFTSWTMLFALIFSFTKFLKLSGINVFTILIIGSIVSLMFQIHDLFGSLSLFLNVDKYSSIFTSSFAKVKIFATLNTDKWRTCISLRFVVFKHYYRVNVIVSPSLQIRHLIYIYDWPALSVEDRRFILAAVVYIVPFCFLRVRQSHLNLV